MKNKKSLLLVLIIIIICALALFFFQQNSSSKTTRPSTQKIIEKTQESFLIEGYPLEEVPLYQSQKIESSKFFVNQDPNSFEDYFGKPVNYFNVVFETESKTADTLAYYQSLMSEVDSEGGSDSRVQGKIGRYKVSASQYSDADSIYLQVYLPQEEYQATNPYFQDYPKIVELDPNWPEYESSYGLLNQKGGEVEYWQYFPFTKDEEEQNQLIEQYQQKYQTAENFSFNPENNIMHWKYNEYTVDMTFSKDHGRIYLMIRKPK